jgi:hypothetical protein
MKKIAILGVLGLLALVVPAQAAPNYSPVPPKGHTNKGHSCTPHNVGYNASGALVNAALTPVGNGRYDGTLEVNLAKANHRAPTGDQTFTLAGAKVKFHQGVDPATPAPGSRVKLHGKITKLSRHCPSDGFTPTITIKRVDISLHPKS